MIHIVIIKKPLFQQFWIPFFRYLYSHWGVDLILIMNFIYNSKDSQRNLFSNFELFGSAESVLHFLPPALCLQLGFELDWIVSRPLSSAVCNELRGNKGGGPTPLTQTSSE